MTRYKRLALALGTAAIVSLLSLTVASADQVYHSERLDLEVTPAGAAAGHPEIRHGQVVNIHPNGPVVAAIEKYMVNGATADTSYDVVLVVDTAPCGIGPVLEIGTATIATDRRGNGHASAQFAPADLAGLSGCTLAVRWFLRADGVDAYATEWTTVVLD